LVGSPMLSKNDASDDNQREQSYQAIFDGSGDLRCIVLLVSAMMSPAQCRAARGLLDWSQQQLAEVARVGVVTVRQFEGGGSTPRNATLDVLVRALESAGVEFMNGNAPGVRLKVAPIVEEPGAEAVADYWQGEQRQATKRRKRNSREKAERDEKMKNED
jgi:transcriptional regulator with XRE-family HTH domain